MPKYHFHVVGINYHAYKGRVDELYAKAIGKNMSMNKESENILESDAVRVYLIDEFVGYISTNKKENWLTKSSMPTDSLLWVL